MLIFVFLTCEDQKTSVQWRQDMHPSAYLYVGLPTHCTAQPLSLTFGFLKQKRHASSYFSPWELLRQLWFVYAFWTKKTYGRDRQMNRGTEWASQLMSHGQATTQKIKKIAL